jgi:hypothetical protein
MLRLYQPCLPTRALKAPSGDRWIHEIKHDGYRLIARRVGSGVRLYTKNGYDYAERYPRIIEAILRLKVSSIVLDGEAICLTGVMDDFDKMWNRTHDHEAKLCAFDLLELDGEDYRPKPLSERKKKLFKLVKKAGRDSIRRAPSGRWLGDFRARLQTWSRGHCLQASGHAVPAGTLEELDQGQEQEASRDAAGEGSVRAGKAAWPLAALLIAPVALTAFDHGLGLAPSVGCERAAHRSIEQLPRWSGILIASILDWPRRRRC